MGVSTFGCSEMKVAIALDLGTGLKLEIIHLSNKGLS
jgi:hypothetical protein